MVWTIFVAAAAFKVLERASMRHEFQEYQDAERKKAEDTAEAERRTKACCICHGLCGCASFLTFLQPGVLRKTEALAQRCLRALICMILSLWA